ncbi:hypothetical protein [Streptomyces antarcticus]|uniref:hypothetical protein n=1 Tax=Streptomyces antarcticus TaxID=2996458 RepID=UPI002270DBD6|nr:MULTISPECIES: hypothetical protein [unclassified Streptomyces]MCY0942325.1 hypothetical protein [Streptomyces sp. H34-AA3]MCZ4080678.1 hypothetical protein [Streptomyces sp. H34-S5]
MPETSWKFALQIIDLAEQTRLLGQVAPTLKALREEMESVRAGEIAKPLREIGPTAIRVQNFAMQCTQQALTLSTSQYAAMKDGHENLAELVEATTQVSLAATLCTFAIHRRTEVLLYEGADETPAASRSRLTEATEELDRAAKTYTRLAHRLSHRLASFAARREDQQLIAKAAGTPSVTTTPKENAARLEDLGPSAGVSGSPRATGTARR